MGWDEGQADEVIRVSFGRDTTEGDAERFLSVCRQIADAQVGRGAA